MCACAEDFGSQGQGTDFEAYVIVKPKSWEEMAHIKGDVVRLENW